MPALVSFPSLSRDHACNVLDAPVHRVAPDLSLTVQSSVALFLVDLATVDRVSAVVLLGIVLIASCTQRPKDGGRAPGGSFLVWEEAAKEEQGDWYRE